MRWFRRKVRIEVVGLIDLGDSPNVMVKLTDVLDDGEKSDVFGVGATPNEAARAAFRHAADLMFPPPMRAANEGDQARFDAEAADLIEP